MNKRHFTILLLTALAGASPLLAEQLRKAAPKYDEQKLHASYKQWVDGLDSLAVATDYEKSAKDLLSADSDRQAIALQALGSTADVRVIPWLIPFIEQENPTLRILAGSAIMKVLLGSAPMKPDGRVTSVTSLKPAAWIALQMFRKPDDGNTWAYAASISRFLRMKEFEDELGRAVGSRHPAVSNEAKRTLESLKSGKQ